MQFSQKLIALVAALQTAQAAALLGFNYGATKSDGYTPMLQADFQTLFTKAQNLVGTSGWNAARLYTSIQTGTDPTEAFAAAIATNTKLLLGLWASSGDQTITNEIAAINNAIAAHGKQFTDLVVGISVGSEDLYRISPTGILNKENPGAGPDVIASYILQTKKALSGTGLSGVPVGHVDTWTAWANSSNQATIDAADFIGVDAYPYFQNTMANSIDNGRALFDDAIQNVKKTVGSKEIWITETGFPVSGPTQNLAVPSADNAKAYWDAVGCGELFNVTNTFWYTLEDNYGGSLSTAGPSFGVVGSDGKELFDLSCGSISKTPQSTSSVSGAASATDAGSPGVTRLPSGVGSGSGSSNNTSAGGSGSGSGSASIITSYSAMTTTNSAGQTVTTSVAQNVTVGGGSGGSGGSGATGTPMSPSTSPTGTPQTGAGSSIVAPVAGVFGAIMAAFAYL